MPWWDRNSTAVGGFWSSAGPVHRPFAGETCTSDDVRIAASWKGRHTCTADHCCIAALYGGHNHGCTKQGSLRTGSRPCAPHVPRHLEALRSGQGGGSVLRHIHALETQMARITADHSPKRAPSSSTCRFLNRLSNHAVATSWWKHTTFSDVPRLSFYQVLHGTSRGNSKVSPH